MKEYQYKNPPITEAVIQFSMVNDIEDKVIAKSLKKIGKLYAEYNPDDEHSVKVSINNSDHSANAKVETRRKHKFFSDDLTEQLHINNSIFSTIQLAPYCGWDSFKGRLARDWGEWQRLVGFQEVSRVGMRYINRIDIPADGPIVHNENYVRVYPNFPEIFEAALGHSISVQFALQDISGRVNINSTVVRSPIPKHLAILLDIDVYRIFESTPSNEELFEFVDMARKKKNEIFESCITEKARELFER